MTTKAPLFGQFLMVGPTQDWAPGWMAAPESSGYLDLDFFKFGMKKLGGQRWGFGAQISRSGGKFFHKGLVVAAEFSTHNFRRTSGHYLVYSYPPVN